MTEHPPEYPFGCMFLAWVAIAFGFASLAGILFQKFFPFLFQ